MRITLFISIYYIFNNQFEYGYSLMVAIIVMLLVILVFCLGFTVSFAQSSAPYKTCILSTDNGYNIVLQQNNDCSPKQLAETVLYYQANGYNQVDSSGITDSNIIRLGR